MRLIEDDPVRTAGSGPHSLQAWKQMPEVFRPICERYSQQVHIQIHLGIFENGQRLVHSYGMTWASQSEDLRQSSIITLRIDDADLISRLDEPLDDTGGHRRLAACRRSTDQEIQTVRRDGDRSPVRTYADGYEVFSSRPCILDKSSAINSSISSATPCPASLLVVNAAI